MHRLPGAPVIRIVALGLVIVLAACGGGDATPVPAGGTAGPSASPGAATAEPAAPGSSAAPESTAAPSSSSDGATGDRITDAYESGAIDRPTALLLRLQASAGDPALPAEYGAPGIEDSAVTAIVVSEWDTFTDAQRDAFLPYVVRPTDPRSMFAQSATASGDGAGIVLASTRQAAQATLTAASCSDGFASKVVDGIPIKVWGQCGGLSEIAVLQLIDEVAADVAEAWGPLVDLMGDPVGDRNDPSDSFPDAPEGDDGLLDIYVVAGSVGGRQRELTTDALATTYATGPLGGPRGAETTSAFMVVDWTAGAGLALRSTIVHELFHALQYAHNNLGTVLPGRDGERWERWWFTEASATWSEHEFVPSARAGEVYPRISTFQEASVGLSSVREYNEYASWLWPLFMRQEEGDDAVGRAWRRVEGLSEAFELHNALSGIVSFDERFGDFAVRAYNQVLEPGDPIDPDFRDLDPAFPDEGPVDPRAEYDVQFPDSGVVERSVSMPALWTHATDLVTDGYPTVTFDFSRMTGLTGFTIDLLVKTEADGWQRRPGSIGKVCNAERVIVVIGNPNPSRGADSNGTWSATGSQDPCNDGNWTVTLTGAKNGAGTYSGRAGSIDCYEDASGKWQFTVYLPVDGDIRLLTGSEDSLHIITRFAMDDPIDWGAGFQRDYEIRVTGDKSQEPWTVHAEAAWHDAVTDSDLSSRVDVTCSEWFSQVP
jgi:hypothetical protein